MKYLKLIPIILCFILLAAHFSRAGMMMLAIISLILPFLLFIKKSVIARILQLSLILGALEWVRIMIVYAQERIYLGEPYIRLVLILSTVALFTAASSLIFQSKSIKEVYKLNKKEQ